MKLALLETMSLSDREKLLHIPIDRCPGCGQKTSLVDLRKCETCGKMMCASCRRMLLGKPTCKKCQRAYRPT